MESLRRYRGSRIETVQGSIVLALRARLVCPPNSVAACGEVYEPRIPLLPPKVLRGTNPSQRRKGPRVAANFHKMLRKGYCPMEGVLAHFESTLHHVERWHPSGRRVIALSDQSLRPVAMAGPIWQAGP